MSIIQVKRIVPASSPLRESPPGLGQGSTIRQRMADFAQDAAGDVAILFGLMALTLFLMIGAAVDIGRWLNARDQTISAIDAAVLAAGRTLQTSSNVSAAQAQADAKNMAKRYYDEAVKSRLPVQSDSISFNIVDNGTAVEASGNAWIKTPILGIFKLDAMQLLKDTGAEHSKAVLAVGGNAELNLEISLMLDTSGSMGEGSKLQDMKDAAKDLVDIVVWANQTDYKSRVALIPFSGDVRIPGAWYGSVTDPTWPSSRTTGSGKKKKTYTRASNCVAERTGTNKYTDVVYGAGNFAMKVYESDGKCSQSSTDNEVVPLSNDKAMLKDKIGKLDLGGGTAGHIGTAWAYYMLSPNWAGLMAADNKPVAYTTPKTNKIAVLMTDGEYNYTFDSLGIPTNSTGDNANGQTSAYQARQICTQMKASGIEVYTVGFDLGDNNTAISTLQNCASDASKAYTADNGEELKAAFRDIALKISSLYLAK